MQEWGVGAILRFVVLGIYALVIVKALGLLPRRSSAWSRFSSSRRYSNHCSSRADSS
jgi:hypothetical protein